jgi:hypothetical protein
VGDRLKPAEMADRTGVVQMIWLYLFILALWGVIAVLAGIF